MRLIKRYGTQIKTTKHIRSQKRIVWYVFCNLVPVQSPVIAMKIFSNLNRHTFEKVRWWRTQTLWHQYLKFIIGHMQMIGSTNDRMRSKLDCLPTPGAHSTHSLFLYSRLNSLFPCDVCTSARHYAAKISFQLQAVWKSLWFVILSEMCLWKKGFCQVMLWSRISCNS